jgi:hypothetical protein
VKLSAPFDVENEVSIGALTPPEMQVYQLRGKVLPDDDEAGR